LEEPTSRFSRPPRPGALQPVPKKKPQPPEPQPPEKEDKKSERPAPRESKSSSLPGIERPYYMLGEPSLAAIPSAGRTAATRGNDNAAIVWTVALAGESPAKDDPPGAEKGAVPPEKTLFGDLPARGTGEAEPEPERNPPIDWGDPLVDDVSALRRLDSQQPIWIDKKGRKFVVLQGVVCNRTAPLELFACVRGSKEHESIVSTPVRPSLCHAALLAAGAESGAPARFQPEYEPARGDRIDIALVWKDARKQRRTAKAEDWILDVKRKKAMQHPWVFAGSRFHRDPDTQRSIYLADAEGSLICVSNFTTAMLDLPIQSTSVDDELLFQAYTERIPPIGTPVTLILTPKKAERQPADPVRGTAKPRRNAPSKAANPRGAEKPANSQPPQPAPPAGPAA
jgi:hypothetical protein